MNTLYFWLCIYITVNTAFGMLSITDDDRLDEYTGFEYMQMWLTLSFAMIPAMLVLGVRDLIKHMKS